MHVSGHLNPGGQQFRGDHGGADPRVAAALAAYLAGQGCEQEALQALSAARLLVPVIAVLSEAAAPAAGDKNSEMMLPKLIGHDGRPGVLAFTCTDALARWRPDARPVPAEAGRVWRAAASDGCAVVIDVAGPVPLAVQGARLAALAAGQPGIAGFSLAAGRADGTDLAVTLRLAVRPTADWAPAVNRAAASIAARLAPRLRRGIEVGITR